MVSEDRQRIIETNRSLRLIKNELETLLEKGVISDYSFTTIQALLPAELSLQGTSTSSLVASLAAVTTGRVGATPSPTTPTAAADSMANLSLMTTNTQPPSYAQTTDASSVTFPTLPARNTATAPAGKPPLCHARALYKYAATDARDCSLERDDRVAVLEYMNTDWWMGRNLRTGQEGIFPSSYVDPEPASATAATAVYDGKAMASNYYKQQTVYTSYPAAPAQQQNPYNSSVPPMAVAEQPVGDQQQQHGGGKVGEYGKKFGKKLGNAAIFGAGATLGSDLVNSIF